MSDIREQKLLYHLTALENIGSIFANGLLPRSMLYGFFDVADQDIINNRARLNLERFVPFHWFARNPFDGRVQADHPDCEFVLITVSRALAARQNWPVIPRHPLATADVQVMDYMAGFDSIDWKTMNRRDYHDANCKSVCMAECLSPGGVIPGHFQAIYVRSQATKDYVESRAQEFGLSVWVSINANMFLA